MSFWKHVNRVIREASIIIEVVDARMIEETRNLELEEKVQKAGKHLLFVVTKCDLVSKDLLKRIKLRPSVYISSKEHFGTTILKKKILEISRGAPVTVGIVGYPNVGKSSLINALAGRGATRTSAESGYTRGFQKIRVDNKILVLDSPGVLPFKEKDPAKHAKIGAVDYGKVKDPEIAAIKLIEDHKEIITFHYNVSGEDPEEILEKIGRKLGKLQKGNTVNIEVTARMVLKDWQTGKIEIKFIK